MTFKLVEESGCQPSNVLLHKLYQVYGNRPVQRDPFGRRAALASEIERALTSARKAAPVDAQKPARG